MKRTLKQGGIVVPIAPIVTEGPLLDNPASVVVTRNRISPRGVETQNASPGPSFRDLLTASTGQEHWEVPG